MKPFKYVTVCSGNICRSPMAEVILKALLKENAIAASVTSCGTLMIEGAPAAPNAVTACAELGLDLSHHRSQGLSYEIIKNSDAIFVMEPIHNHTVMAIDKHARTVKLWEYSDQTCRFIFDPVGQNLEIFRKSRDEIYKALTKWLNLCSKSPVIP